MNQLFNKKSTLIVTCTKMYVQYESMNDFIFTSYLLVFGVLQLCIKVEIGTLLKIDHL